MLRWHFNAALGFCLLCSWRWAPGATGRALAAKNNQPTRRNGNLLPAQLSTRGGLGGLSVQAAVWICVGQPTYGAAACSSHLGRLLARARCAFNLRRLSVGLASLADLDPSTVYRWSSGGAEATVAASAAVTLLSYLRAIRESALHSPRASTKTAVCARTVTCRKTAAREYCGCCE